MLIRSGGTFNMEDYYLFFAFPALVFTSFISFICSLSLFFRAFLPIHWICFYCWTYHILPMENLLKLLIGERAWLCFYCYRENLNPGKLWVQMQANQTNQTNFALLNFYQAPHKTILTGKKPNKYSSLQGGLFCCLFVYPYLFPYFLFYSLDHS